MGRKKATTFSTDPWLANFLLLINDKTQGELAVITDTRVYPT